MMASQSPPSPFARLPNELVAHILRFVGQPPLSEDRIYDDPALILNDGYNASMSNHGSNIQSLPPLSDAQLQASPPPGLKSASLVCRRWRALAMPFLFRHVVWTFRRFDRPPPGADALTAVPELAWLRFLRRSNLLYAVRSLTIVVAGPVSQVGEDLSHHFHSGIQPCHIPASTLMGDGSPDPDAAELANPFHPDEPICNDWLWDAIFALADPATITLIASPASLASLLGRPIDLSSAWLFRQRLQIVSLSRTTPRPPASAWRPSPLPPLSPAPPPPLHRAHVPCNLFTIREWTSLLVNEGSSVKAYATYEYFTHNPPTLLPALLDPYDPSTRDMLSSLVSMSYIAIFPLSSHIEEALIPNIPSIYRFYIQIVPRVVNYADPNYRHPAIDVNDFWAERNASYSLLALAVFDMVPFGRWRDLRVFESGDSSDIEAWEQAVRFVVHNAGMRWQVNSNGVFVRRHQDFPTPGLPASGWVISGQ